jgi:hypothetical protein
MRCLYGGPIHEPSTGTSSAAHPAAPTSCRREASLTRIPAIGEQNLRDFQYGPGRLLAAVQGIRRASVPPEILFAPGRADDILGPVSAAPPGN